MKIQRELRAQLNAHMLVFEYSDNVSKAMVEYFPKIQKLSMIDGDLELALKLVLYLGAKSFLTRSDTASDGSVLLHNRRKSDSPADDLLLDVLKRIRQRDHGFMPGKEFAELTRQQGGL
jgi:hypothetical protein